MGPGLGKYPGHPPGEDVFGDELALILKVSTCQEQMRAFDRQQAGLLHHANLGIVTERRMI